MRTERSVKTCEHVKSVYEAKCRTRRFCLDSMRRSPLHTIFLFAMASIISVANAQPGPVERDRAGRAINPNDVPRRAQDAVPDNSERVRTQGAAESAEQQSIEESPFLQLNDFRSIDGFDNNVDNPEWGQAGMPLLRQSVPAYADGAGEPSGGNRPNARLISNIVADQQALLPSSDSISDFVWQWGQFLDHDIDLTPTSDPADPFDIAVPLGDLFFDPDSTGTQIISLNRSSPLFVNGVREQLNIITSYIDASNVYGSEEELALKLRTLDGTGRLKSSNGDLLPLNLEGDPNVPADGFPMFYAGDERVNEQVGLTVMHTLFMREHNYWADRIHAGTPGLDDEGIYQRARAMVAAEIQCITFNEFLPILLGEDAIGPYEAYKPDLNATISNEFATAAYRVGHTMLSPQLLRLDAELNPIDAGALALRNAFFNPTEVIGVGIEPYLRGLATQTAQEIDSYVIDDVRNFLFGDPGGGGFDLASLNLQRGRDHGLPSYNDVRAAYGLPAISSFAEVSSDPVVQQRLLDAFATVDDMDLWIVGLSEDHVPGALVGETFWTILQDQFLALRDGDRYWYERYLPQALQREVENRSLSSIIRRNTDIRGEIAGNVFLVGEPQDLGSLSVTIGPAAAVSNGAMWRVDGGAWLESGVELSDLAVGAHTVEYADAAGFITPPIETITIGVGEKSTSRAIYRAIQTRGGCFGGTTIGTSTAPPADFLLLSMIVMLFAFTSKVSRKRVLAPENNR